MSVKDVFKKSVLESFTVNNGITMDFVLKAVIALVIALLLGMVIFLIYKNFYGGVVYNASFGVTLVGMTVLTCALTLAISSNIVISLGMVGALSIVRYRTAIKDPMDLLYLFWSISIGIIVAANVYFLAFITMVVMFILVSVLYARKKSGKIYVCVIHYAGEETDSEIMRLLSGIKYQIKSKTLRKGQTELTIQLMSKQNSPVFVDKIDALEGVNDISLIQYNGEYNG